MASIPKPIRDWISQFFAEEDVPQSSSDVTVTDTQVGSLSDGEYLQNSGGSLTGSAVESGGGGEITESVATYGDLPIPASAREFYYIEDQADIVVPTDADLEVWRSVSDFEAVVAGIPDDGLLHDYNPESIAASDGDSITSIPDEEGSADVSGDSQTFVENYYNGKSAIEITPTSDPFTNSDPTISQPILMALVIQSNDSGEPQFIAGASENRFALKSWWSGSTSEQGSGRGYDFGDSVDFGTQTEDVEIIIVKADGTDSYYRLNGSEITSGDDVGTNDMDGIAVGAGDGAVLDIGLDGNLLRYLIYDATESADPTDIESALNDIYDVY